MRHSTKKQIMVFTAGSIINLLLFCLTKYTAFPFWLDYAGSFYIAAFCGPVLSVLSVFVHTVLLALLIDGGAAFAFLPAAVAVCAVVFLFKQLFNRTLANNFSMLFCSSAAVFLINGFVFLVSKNLFARYAQYDAIFKLLWQTHGKFAAAILVSAAVSFIEILLSFIIVGLFGFITPKKEESLTFKK